MRKGEGKVLLGFKYEIIICRQMFLPLNYASVGVVVYLIKPFLNLKCCVGFYLFYRTEGNVGSLVSVGVNQVLPCLEFRFE